MLIGYYLDKNETIMNAVKKTTERLDGTWGLAIIHKDHDNQLICARMGSPLLIGFA